MAKVYGRGEYPAAQKKVRPTPQELRENILARHRQPQGGLNSAYAIRGARFWTGLKELIWSLSLTVLALGVIFTYLTGVDFSHFAPSIEQAVTSQTHLIAHVRGPMRIEKPIFRPAVVMEDITLSSAGVGREREATPTTLAEIAKLKLSINPVKLFSSNGRMVIDEVSVEGATLFLYADGNGDFLLEPFVRAVKALLDSIPPYFGDGALREISLQASTFVRISSQGDEIWTMPVSMVRLKVDDEESNTAPLEITWSGELGGKPFTLSGTVTDYLKWLQGGKTELALKGSAGGIDINLSGFVTGLAQPIVDLNFEIVSADRALQEPGTADNSQESTEIFGAVNGGFMESISGSWSGAYAGGPVEGQFNMSFGDAPSLSLDASSGVLDAEFVSNAAHFLSKYFQGDKRAPFQFISSAEAHLHLQTDLMRLNSQALGSAELNLSLSNGAIAAHMRQEISEGKMVAALSVNAQETPVFNFSVSIANINPAHLTRSSAQETASNAMWIDAPLLASAELLSQGEDWDALLKNLSGEATLVLGIGTVNQALLNLMPTQLVELARDEAGLPAFDCLIASVGVDEGKVRSRMLWAETPNGMITGSGSIDMVEAKLDMIIRPRPKDPRALANAVDLTIRGPLLSPALETLQKDLTRGLASGLGRFAAVGQDSTILPLLRDDLMQNNSCLKALGSVNRGEG